MHEEEENYTSASAAIEEHPSSSPAVGGVITPVGGTLVAVQDVPKDHLNQGMQTIPPHVISVHHMEICGDMPSWQLHDLESKNTVDLE